LEGLERFGKVRIKKPSNLKIEKVGKKENSNRLWNSKNKTKSNSRKKKKSWKAGKVFSENKLF